MSKKVFNVFSILCFALVLCFMGCTELINPKTETDINLNIDLSKIIKSTRNTGETQSSVSLGENPTIKVAIYDAKKYNATTNSTDNLDLITEAQAKIVNNEAKVKLNNIPVGIDAIVFAELSFSNGNSTEVMYAGNSEVFRVKLTDNKISLVLMKVGNSETYPDDTNTPYENYTLYKKTENGEEEISNDNEATISTSSTMETKVIVTNPDSSESVWTYFVKPNNNIRFTESANYKVSVELKADKTTVVGIAAARADYFFTVNSDWTPCEFNTGYLIGNENHQFTIGLGLSSEIEIRNLKIEKLETTDTTDTTEPSLVFDISKDAINSYLEQEYRPENIVDVTKEATNRSYNITINTPMCHSTDNSVIQDVKLHLRSYATENTGANKVSFNITNNSNDFETSVMADTASDKSISWNNNATKISDNDGNFSVDFPNYEANDELIVDLITSSTLINNSTSFKLSNFKVGKAETPPFSDKIFAIQVDDNWTKIEVGAAFSKEIGAHNSINFDVLMFNKDAWFDGNNSLDETTALKEATRFVLDGDDIASDLAEKFIYSTLSNESGNPIYNLKNDFDEDKTVQIKLNENYEVVIEESTSISGGGISLNEISSWEELENKIRNLSDDTTTEFIIMDNLTATCTITVRNPVKIISDKEVKITRGYSSDGVNFEDSFFSVESAGNLELGSNENKIILDGQKVNSTNDGGAVYVSGGTFTMNNSSIINCSTNVNGGAVYITNKGNFNMNGGTIDECFATDSGGGVWMNNGSSFTMFGDSKINKCESIIEGGGVYVTDSSVPCTFKMLDRATITECTARNGGGVSYYCGPDSTFEILENAEISKNIANGNDGNDGNNGGGIYLYGKLTMEGGTISGNKAPSGAGVYVRDGSSFTMNGGKISDNNATVSGAGVYLSDSTSSFTMTYGTISNNLVNSINNGASIEINNNGTVNLPNFDPTKIGDSFKFDIIDGEVQYPSGGTTTSYSVGDVYPKDGTPIGVVFKTDTEYVYIVGLDERNCTYGTQSCVNQIKTSNVTFNYSSDGCQNMTNWYSFITTNSADFSSDDFPAFNYCLTYRDTEGEGGTWYLPSKEELSTIKSNITNINTTLETEGTGIDTNTNYWSSTYSSDGKASIISTYSGSTSEYTLSTPCYVRPCKRIKNDGSSDVLIGGLDSANAVSVISNISAGEHYIKLASSVNADDLEYDIYDKLYNLLDDDGNPTAFVYLDLSSTHIQELPPKTFYRLASLKGITLPSTIETIDASAFQGCINLTKFVVPADNQYFTVDESKTAILLSKDESKLISYPSATEGYTIPENITSLAEYAFGHATNLKSVTIHANLTDIPSNAFYGAWNLKTFTVNSSNPKYTTDETLEILLSIDKTELISWPYAYEVITIPNSVTKIADYALAETEITSVVLNNVEEIGEYAFYSCLGHDTTNFTELTIPSSVTKIGKYAFYSCKNLTSVKFADTNVWSVVNDEDKKTSIDVTNFDVKNLIYASDDEDAQGFADYTWIKDSSSTSGGGIANYTDTAGISISGYPLTNTSLVTVISGETKIDCSDEVNGVFGLYWGGSVTLSPFAMGQYEVTQELYKAIMTENPSYFKDTITSGEIQELRPVETVSWYEAVAFCNELTKQTFGEQYCVYYTDESLLTVYTTDDASDKNLPYFDQSKKGYRLPTQAEWEFAARGGDELQECWSYPYPGLSEDTNDSLLTIAWFVSNANSVSHEVGLKTPNTLSLYDMAGNLMEWCWDYYLEDFSIGNGNNPTGPDSGEERILCGGYFDDYSDSCYSYSSTSYSPIPNDNWINTVGFRICRSL